MPRPLLLVAGTAFLLMLGLSVLFPVLPFYIRWLDLTEFEAGVLLSIYAGIGVIVAPFWGRFSERVGRKPAIIVGLLGFSVGFGLFGLGETFLQLLGARVLGGLFAAAALPAIFAYVADVSAPERRSVAMGTVGAAIGLGIITGPVFGGFLAPLGLRIPFFTSAGIGLLGVVCVLLWLPESHDAAGRADARDRAAAAAAAARSRLSVDLAPYLVFGFLLATARVGFESTVGFYIDDRFGGGPRSVGLLLGLIGLVGVGIQGGGIRVLTRRYSDFGLLLTGTLLSAVGLAGLAWVWTWGSLIPVGIVFAIGYALSTPTFTALVSRAGEERQGETQGLNQAAQSLGRVAGPVIFTSLYQWTGPQVVFNAAGGLTLVALLLAWSWMRLDLRRRAPAS